MSNKSKRIGRIDRIGQREKEIKIYNFLLKDSIDEKVYGALHRRCRLFEHFVGPMQPVLARAQTMLNRPKEFSIDDLERIAAEVETNYLNAEAYLDSDAVEMKPANPTVTRADILAALDMLRPEFGFQVNLDASKAALSIKVLGGKSPRFAMSDQ